jgi:2-dehydropantoate 2-reductase
VTPVTFGPVLRAIEIMKDKLKIWIYGAGAIGCFYGSHLVRAGHDVLFVARGEQLKTMQKTGLKIKSILGDFGLVTPPQDELKDKYEPNLVIVAVKTYDSQQVAEKLFELLSSNIPIFVFQNGVRSHEVYEKILGKERVYRAVLNIAVSIFEPGIVTHSSGGFIGLQNDGKYAPTMLESFKAGKLPGEVTSNITEFIWSKMAWNAPFNTVTALSRLKTNAILQDADGQHLIREIIAEVVQLANANGVNLPAQVADDKINFTLNKLGDITTSTLEDVKQSKTLEYNAVVGDLIAEAKRHNLQVPHLQTVYTLLKLLDKSFNRSERVSNLPIKIKPPIV